MPDLENTEGDASATYAVAGLQARLDAIYTPLDEAVAELQRRRAIFGGSTPGREWLPTDLPEDPRGYAFLFRYIATPSFETLRFLELAKTSGLSPVIWERWEDKYANHNPIKQALVQMGFHRGHDKHGNPLVEYLSVVAGNQYGRPFSELRTLWQQELGVFHNDLLVRIHNGDFRAHLCDYSRQVALAGGNPAGTYSDFILKLCIADGILFEDFLLDKLELPFTRDVVLPAFDALIAEFGMKPLVVHIDASERASSPHWFWYPSELKSLVDKKLTAL